MVQHDADVPVWVYWSCPMTVVRDGELEPCDMPTVGMVDSHSLEVGPSAADVCIRHLWAGQRVPLARTLGYLTAARPTPS